MLAEYASATGSPTHGFATVGYVPATSPEATMLFVDPPAHTSGVELPDPYGVGMLDRVSTSRHGVIATSIPSSWAPPVVSNCGLMPFPLFARSRAIAFSCSVVACQESGAAQFLNGTGSAACAHMLQTMSKPAAAVSVNRRKLVHVRVTEYILLGTAV
jgi:hypothetical protein